MAGAETCTPYGPGWRRRILRLRHMAQKDADIRRRRGALLSTSPLRAPRCGTEAPDHRARESSLNCRPQTRCFASGPHIDRSSSAIFLRWLSLQVDVQPVHYDACKRPRRRAETDGRENRLAIAY